MIDESRRQDIESEERLRLEVRRRLEGEALRRDPPNYWTGFVLNVLVVGVGFFTIAEAGWAVVWLLLAVVLNPMTMFLAWPFIAFGSLVHYRNVYAAKYGPTA